MCGRIGKKQGKMREEDKDGKEMKEKKKGGE
jgi:hypothetical protein